MNNNALRFREAWNRLFLFHNIEVCSEKLKGCGMLELKILKLICHSPNYSIKELLRILDIPNSTMTNVINRLTSKGLLHRKLSNKDLRSFDLKLTEKGKEAVAEHLEAETGIFENMLNSLEDNEKEEFIRLFEKIIGETE